VRRPVTAALSLLAASTLLTVLPSAGPAAAQSASIRVGQYAEAIAVSPDGTRAYVTGTDSNTVSIIDTATNVVAGSFSTAMYPNAIAVSPDGRRLYISAMGAHVLQTLDAADGHQIATARVGSSPSALVLSPDGARAYVADAMDNAVTAVDLATSTTTRIPVRSITEAIAISPDGATVYDLVTGMPSAVAVIDTASAKVTRTISLGDYSTRILTSSDGRWLYVTNSTEQSEAGTLLVVEASSGRIVRRIPMGTRPGAMSFAADGQHLLVASLGGNLMGERRTASNALVSTVDPQSGALLGTREVTGHGSVGTEIVALAANPHGASAYASLGGTRYVATLDQGAPPATPGQPTGIRVIRSGSTATITWQAPATGGTDLTYSVVAVPMAEGPLPARRCTTQGRSCRLTAINSRLGYQVLVQARNAAGWGPSAAAWSGR
jgi:YVTN family beta-propeller protein